jgi:IS30 family transposase
MRISHEAIYQAQGHVTGDVVLSQRPAEAADRAIPGHWESQ